MNTLQAYFKANRGKQYELAGFLKLQPSTVSQWKEVPPKHVRKVAEFTGLSLEELRPDLYADVDGVR